MGEWVNHCVVRTLVRRRLASNCHDAIRDARALTLMRYRRAGTGYTQTSSSVVFSVLSAETPVVCHCLMRNAREMTHFVVSTMQLADTTLYRNEPPFFETAMRMPCELVKTVSAITTSVVLPNCCATSPIVFSAVSALGRRHSEQARCQYRGWVASGRASSGCARIPSLRGCDSTSSTGCISDDVWEDSSSCLSLEYSRLGMAAVEIR